jgi:hypothetical protein
MIQFCSRFVRPRIRIVRVPKGPRGTIVSAGLIANLIREGEPPEFADCGNRYSAAPSAGYGYYAERRTTVTTANSRRWWDTSRFPNLPRAPATMPNPMCRVTSGKRPSSRFNPGCPMPTSVAGFAEAEPHAEAEPFAGYQRPHTVVRPVYASTGRNRVVARNFQAALVSTRNLKPQF